jgi:VCBS repeat-containing protein
LAIRSLASWWRARPQLEHRGGAGPGVLGNDEDVEGDALTAALVSAPAHGTLTVNPNGSFNDSPDGDYIVSDSFTYKANDGSLDSNTATVSLTVTAVNDAALTTKTQAMNGDLKVPSGSEMRVGYSFTIPGAHAAANIGFVECEGHVQRDLHDGAAVELDVRGLDRRSVVFGSAEQQRLVPER